MAVSQCAPPSLDTDGTSSGNFHSTVDWSMLMDSLLWVFSALDGLLEYSLYRSCSTPAVGMLVAGSWSPWRESTSGNPSSCFPVLVNSSILTSNSTNQFHQPSAELECIWILSAICSIFLSAIFFLFLLFSCLIHSVNSPHQFLYLFGPQINLEADTVSKWIVSLGNGVIIFEITESLNELSLFYG